MSEARGDATIGRALRQTALLVGGGLVVQALSLQVVHPTAFLTFAIVGGGLVVLGFGRGLVAVVRGS